jgi:hypothetical protein
VRKIKRGVVMLVFFIFCSVFLCSCQAIEAQNINLDNNAAWNGGQVHNDNQPGRGAETPDNAPGMNNFEPNRGGTSPD